MARRQQTAEPEKKQLFLEVQVPDRYSDYWPWGDGGRYTLHDPGDGRLVVQRRDRREPAAVYSAIGWTRYRWIMVEPSRVETQIADTIIP